MERQHESGKPFFIYHTTHHGHDAFDWFHPDSDSSWPGTPVVEWKGDRYVRTEPNVTGDKGVYDTHGTVTGPGIHHHVNYLDYQVWRYRQKLEKMGIADNTILIFCADNGTGGYGKHSPDCQKGTHVPLIIHAPGMTKRGKQDVLVNMADFLPTLADLTGAKLPANYEHNGESLLPFLFTDKPAHRDWIYAYSGEKQLIRGTHVLRDGKWWDVSTTPTDLISFEPIKDRRKVADAHPIRDLHITPSPSPRSRRQQAHLLPRRSLQAALSVRWPGDPGTHRVASQPSRSFEMNPSSPPRPVGVSLQRGKVSAPCLTTQGTVAHDQIHEPNNSR